MSLAQLSPACFSIINLVIDPENISDVNPNVDGVDFVGEGQVELVVVVWNTEMLVGDLSTLIMNTDKVISRPAEDNLKKKDRVVLI